MALTQISSNKNIEFKDLEVINSIKMFVEKNVVLRCIRPVTNLLPVIRVTDS